MKDAEKLTWYRLALARRAEPTLLLAAQGEHLGAAIATAEKFAGIGTHVIACDVAQQGVPLGESVGKHHVVELGTADDHEVLRWPTGVLPQIGHTAELGGAAAGWMRHADPTGCVIEAQTDNEHLVDVFLGMIERMPAADNLEVRVLDHFEDATCTDVWLTSRVDGRKILAFLDDYDTDLIENGHVELSVYMREPKATLRLTEHKTVVWIGADGAMAGQVGTWFKELHVPAVTSPDALVRLAKVPHFHYRRAKTRNRKKLSEELFRQRMRKVASLEPSVPLSAVGSRAED